MRKMQLIFNQNNGLTYIPKWLTNKGLIAFLLAFGGIAVVWSEYTVPLGFAVVSVISVFVFFYGGNTLSNSWKNINSKDYVKRVFIIGILLRAFWSLYVYFWNQSYFGTTLGSLEDVGFYVSMGQEAANSLSNFNFSFIDRWLNVYKISIDDIGYPLLLGIEYALSGNISDVVVPFICKTLMGAYTSVLIYKIAHRHFDENVARIAAVFCMLNPNMIWWCASMMKEADMVFFSTLFVERMDNALTQKKISFVGFVPAALIGSYVFLYRAALGAVTFLAFFATIILVSRKIVSTGKKVLAGLLVALVLAVGMGQTIIDKSKDMYENVRGGGQKGNMEWRSKRAGGNQFAKYAGAAVFAPLIFTLPFPTLSCANPNQFSQMQLSGGNYIKNVLSAFVIYAMIVLVFSGEWRKHVFPMSFMLGYLVILVMSGYAQSGRFHMPIWPFEMMFAAYGLCMLPKKKKYWINYVLVGEIVICFAWQWFKLKGRGMI